MKTGYVLIIFEIKKYVSTFPLLLTDLVNISGIKEENFENLIE